MNSIKSCIYKLIGQSDAIINNPLQKNRFLKQSDVISKLNYAYSVAKRLDEHREFVESLVKECVFLKKNLWHVNHLATQDDYLMRLFYMVNGVWPERSFHVRERPVILGACQLPEFKKQSRIIHG
jgi:hypothetical protein